jgi:hypothetical protein
MRALRVVGCFVLGLVSLLALGLVLPLVKEGYDRDELPLFASIAGGLAALALVWWRLNRRHRAIAVAGVALLAPPMVVYAGLSTRVAANEWRGRRLSQTVRILSLREVEIRWPGRPGPVGVRLEIEVQHAIGLEGNLFPPKVIMGTDPRPTRADYWSGSFGGVASLSTPASELEQPPPARDVFLRPGRTRVVYEMFPSTLERRDGEALCVNGTADRTGDGGRASSTGTHLGAAWFFAAAGGLYVDLGGPLTDALRRESVFEGKPAAWTALLHGLDPSALAAAGYAPCPPPRQRVETCYCPPAASP